MKVFISWSGETSKQLAEVFRKWIPGVLQAVKPYFTPDDITKGARWSSEISSELESSKVGLIFLTKDNLNSPWLMFEAGALSKNIDKSKVVPILFEIEPSDIVGPLVQFQAAKFSKAEIRKVVIMFNKELGSAALANDVLDPVFEMWYPKLEKDINEILASIPSHSGADIRSDRDLIEEILELTRRINLKNRVETNSISPNAIGDLIENYEILGKISSAMKYTRITRILIEMRKSIEHIIEKSINDDNHLDLLNLQLHHTSIIMNDSMNANSKNENSSRSKTLDLRTKDTNEPI